MHRLNMHTTCKTTLKIRRLGRVMLHDSAEFKTLTSSSTRQTTEALSITYCLNIKRKPSCSVGYYGIHESLAFPRFSLIACSVKITGLPRSSE